MALGDRLAARLRDSGLSHAELARRVGVQQPTITRLVNGRQYGSKHLHRIARELGTTPAYLAGETDDSSASAPPPAPVAQHQHLTLSVALPSEPRLAEAFRAILLASRDMSEAELARELARRLPIVLRAASTGALSPAMDADDDPDALDEDHASAPPPARRAAGK